MTIIAYEIAIREQRLRTEISQAKKSNAFYLTQADKAKQINAMESKKEAKKLASITPSTSDDNYVKNGNMSQINLSGTEKSQNNDSRKIKVKRAFRQRQPIQKEMVGLNEFIQSS